MTSTNLARAKLIIYLLKVLRCTSFWIKKHDLPRKRKKNMTSTYKPNQTKMN